MLDFRIIPGLCSTTFIKSVPESSSRYIREHLIKGYLRIGDAKGCYRKPNEN